MGNGSSNPSGGDATIRRVRTPPRLRTLGPRPDNIPGFEIESQPAHIRVGLTQTVKKSHKLKNRASVSKDSLKLVRDETQPNLLLLSFEVNASVAVTLSVHFFATDQHSASTDSRSRAKFTFFEAFDRKPSPHTILPLPPQAFNKPPSDSEPQKIQTFKQPPSDGILEEMISDKTITYDSERGYYPVILVMEVQDQAIRRSKEEISAYATYGTLVKEGDGYRIDVVKRSIIVDREQFEMFEIYGLEQRRGRQGTSGESECVICLTEEREIAILPCRHLCLCETCAQRFYLSQGNRCPVCRVRMESMLKISSDDWHNESQTDPVN